MTPRKSRPRRGAARGRRWVLVALSVTCSMSIDPYYYNDPAMADQDRLSRLFVYLTRSFTVEQTLGCFLVAGSFLLLRGLEKVRPTARETGLAAVFGALFSIAQVFGRSFAENGNWDAVFASRFIFCRALVMFSGRALLAGCVVLYGFRLLDRAPSPSPPPTLSKRRFALTVGLVSLCYLPYLLYFYPGFGNPDTSMQIAWSMHLPTEWLQYSAVRGADVFATNHHPYFTTVLFGAFAKLGLKLGDVQYGVALYCLLQLIATAAICVGGWTYLRRLGLDRRICRAGLIFTTFFPLFPLYAITMLKDPLFSLCLLTLAFLLLELARTGGERLRKNWSCAALFAAGALVSLTKNQGVYFVAVIAAIVMLFYPHRLRSAVSLLVPALLFQFVWLDVLLPAWNVAPGGRQEVLGPLFQQTARYVSTYPDDVTEEEADAIRAVLDYDRLPELYVPTLSDSVKFSYDQDCTAQERSAYFRAWAEMGRRHPDAYIQATIHNVYGSFYVEHETGLSYVHFDVRGIEDYPQIQVPTSPHLQRAELPLRVGLRSVQHIPGIGAFFRIGAYPWAILFLFLDALRRRQYGRILPQMPCILTVGVLFLSPVSGSYRYAMPMTFSLPFLFAASLLPSCGPEPRETEARSPLTAQILRFGLVGGLCFLIDYGLLALQVEVFSVPTLLASAVSFCVSVTVNYLLSTRYVFQGQKSGPPGRDLPLFVLLSAVGLGLNQLLMLLGTRGLAIHYLVVKLFATAVVMVYNFVSRKLLLERPVRS